MLRFKYLNRKPDSVLEKLLQDAKNNAAISTKKIVGGVAGTYCTRPDTWHTPTRLGTDLPSQIAKRGKRIRPGPAIPMRVSCRWLVLISSILAVLYVGQPTMRLSV